MMKNIFSIVVLLYNNSEYLFECISSILIQDYPEIEIIVVDDCSRDFDRDNIINFLESNKSNNIINYTVYQNETNLGTVKSANAALKKTSGEYIKLLAADDALYDEKTLSSAAKALNNCCCGIITGDVMKCNQDLVPISTYRNKLAYKLNKLEPTDVFRRLCVHNDIVAGGVFFSKLFFDKYGFFDETYRLIEDWPTWLNATRLGCCIFYEPFYAIKYRFNGGVGTSINPIYMADKKKVFINIIYPAKKQIGLFWYIKAKISFYIINSQLIRKIYGAIFRKK